VRLGDIHYQLLGNAYYARCVEREAFDAKRRTVVWVGAAHAPLRPSGQNRHKSILGLDHCMGSMLAGRYGSAVGQAILQGDAKTDRVAALIEECAKLCSRTRIGFAPAESPFAALHDEDAYKYMFRPGAGLADLASYYIMLAPQEGLRECEWMEGFLSRRMLGTNRPYYEWLAGGAIGDLDDGNRRISEGTRRL